ncbi:conserved Plasmodium protein, unknown function [Plasmodium sp. gorilla clade G2]|uniref:conserved Plasmodium protein, unknown function n=1 Tax=Plasmodium sp. gorilla clade G2 TaxID=880535 RepID=UPI000D20BD35|nr:conserved Plasmodium protein, unknown function [Plasmodium sp. gorilla clade G2]SOV10725.1 conserved Plasmodium protein, unknown function [Plasmodium sp. gorilla clade G2]
MAFMFKREGCYSKNRLNEVFRKNKPFINQLMYDLTSFHYENYMKNKIHKNIMNNYNNIEKIQSMLNLINGEKENAFKIKTGYFYFRSGVPVITPHIEQSNEFAESNNYTYNFKNIKKKYLKEVYDSYKHKIGGTDPSVPHFYKHK